MSKAFIGEIRMVGFDYAPEKWAKCDGSRLVFETYDKKKKEWLKTDYYPLYELIGTIYGKIKIEASATKSFVLPDLRGRVPIHTSNSYPLGKKGGAESVTLKPSEIPHTHIVQASPENGERLEPGQEMFLARAPIAMYGNEKKELKIMNNSSVTTGGGGLPHENRQPFQAVNFIIALLGEHPSKY